MRLAPQWKLVVVKREERCGGCGKLIEPGVSRFEPVRAWKFPGRTMLRCLECGVRHVSRVDRVKRGRA